MSREKETLMIKTRNAEDIRFVVLQKMSKEDFGFKSCCLMANNSEVLPLNRENDRLEMHEVESEVN